MPAMPRDTGFDHSLAFLADPYRFISGRCRRYGSDVFETRLMFRRTICMSGARAAELFYDSERFRRAGAAPEPLLATLFGKGGVQGLDGPAHRGRKAMFMRLAAPDRVVSLIDFAAGEWRYKARGWSAGGRVALYDELRELLTRAVCAWAGLPLTEAEVEERTRQLSELFDEAVAPGLGHLRSRLARKQAERWLAGRIREIRAGRIEVPENCAIQAVAWHRDADERLLPPGIAAVELLNVLRPTVATSVFALFAAHALHAHPECRYRIAGGDPAYALAFVQEVRRWYPFFPAVAALVRHDFEWEGYFFPAGRRVMLDLYGTDHDPRRWDEPESFRPERFLARSPTPFDFIPQGGGDAAGGHRCPGEGITVALLQLAVEFLVNRLDYQVPPQDVEIDYARLPALPRDRFVIESVRLR